MKSCELKVQAKEAILKKYAFVTSISLVVVVILTYSIHIYSIHRISTLNDLHEVIDTLKYSQHNHRCISNKETKFRCLPNVIFIGASKCGTTSMTDYLSQVPNVFFTRRRKLSSSMKAKNINSTVTKNQYIRREIHRFDRASYHNTWKSIEYLDEYISSPIMNTPYYPLIHYTPHYLYAPSVPYDIYQFYPYPEQLKFIIMLRHPIERSISSYWFKTSHLFTKTKKDEGSIEDFEQMMTQQIQERYKYEACLVQYEKTHPYGRDEHYNSNFENTTNSISDSNYSSPRTTHNIKTESDSHLNTDTYMFKSLHHQHQYDFNKYKTCFGSIFQRKILGHKHIDKSIYSDQLKRWFSVFSKQQFFIFTLEEWKRQPKEVFVQLLNFIGVENSTIQSLKYIENIDEMETDTFENTDNLKYINLTLRHLSQPNHHAKLHSLSSRTYQKLQSFFKPYNDQLYNLLDKHLYFE